MQTVRYTGNLKIGDLIRRKINRPMDVELSESTGVYGIVVERSMSGNPLHPCVKVLYTKTGKVYSIAESRVEVVSVAK